MKIHVLLLASLLVAPAVTGQWTATVNDPMSHGTIGNGKLSLDEAIRVMNVQLPKASLDAAEQAQIDTTTGILPALQTILIDAAITPVITIEKQLTNVFGDTVAHVNCDFIGINGRPLINATGKAFPVFIANTNHFHLDNMVVLGGTIGVTYDATLHYHPGVRGRIFNSLFQGQTDAGVELLAPPFPPFPPGETWEMDFIDMVMLDLPTGIRFKDVGVSSLCDITGTGVLLDGCDIGMDFDLRGSGPVNCKAYFNRTDILDSVTGVRVQRPTGSNTILDLRLVHGEIVASRSAIDVQSNQFATSKLFLHHLDVRGGPLATDYALRAYPSGAKHEIQVGECNFDGNVELGANALSPALRFQNSRVENGSFAIETTGPLPNLLYDVFESAPVTVRAGTTKNVKFNFCEFVRSDVTDLTAAGLTNLNNSFVGSSILTNVTENASAPMRWIGRTSVTPKDPPIGAVIDLQVDLQPGTAVVWLFGNSLFNPFVTLAPTRFYADPVLLIPLPGTYSGQDRIRLSIPNDPALVGAEVYAMPAMIPTAGQNYVPAVTFPRGGRFEITQ